ncbi:MAG: efflux transporter outer membrane subunit [Muribaculaceae bacterium]
MAMSSCGIYSNYQRPTLEVDADSLYRDYVKNSAAHERWLGELSWRELITDEQLVHWIEVGLEHNTDLRTAQLRTQEAGAMLQAAKLAFLPSVSASAQGTVSKYGSSKATKTYQLGPSAEWVIDAFGSLRNAKKGSFADMQAGLAYEQAVKTQLIAEIACSYYMLVALDEQRAVTDSTVTMCQNTVTTMEALWRVGDQTEAAVQQSRATLLQTQSQLQSLEQQIVELENQFSALLGITPQPIARGKDIALACDQDWCVGVPAQMLSRRPDVQQAEWKLASAFYATNKARSAFYPTITLRGEAGWTNSAGAAVVNPGKWLLNAVGTLTQPLFNRGVNQANLKVAKAQQEEATLTFTQTLLNAGVEVNNAMAALHTARNITQIDADRIAALQRTVEVTQALMRTGNVNYLEVITAQQGLLSARVSQVQNSYTLVECMLQLYCALGGGCS